MKHHYLETNSIHEFSRLTVQMRIFLCQTFLAFCQQSQVDGENTVQSFSIRQLFYKATKSRPFFIPFLFIWCRDFLLCEFYPATRSRRPAQRQEQDPISPLSLSVSRGPRQVDKLAVVSGDLCLCQKGRRKRHAVTECCQPHSLVSQGFPMIHVCAEAEQRAQRVVTVPPFPSPPLTSIPLLLSIHLFVCGRFRFRRLANCCRTTPFNSPSQPAVPLPGPAPFSSISRPLLGDLQDVQKKLSHTQLHLRASAARTGDFTALMTGHTLPSWDPHRICRCARSYSLILKLFSPWTRCSAGEGKLLLTNMSWWGRDQRLWLEFTFLECPLTLWMSWAITRSDLTCCCCRALPIKKEKDI